MDTSLITFIPLTEPDLTLIHTWLNIDHVRLRWGNKEISLEEVKEKYGAIVNGSEPTLGYIIRYDNMPIGLIQTYKIDSYLEYKKQIGIDENAAGLDLFIGDVNYLGKGLGSKIIRKFADEIIFPTYDVVSCISDPVENNIASVKAFKNAGFTFIKNIIDPDTGEEEVLLRLEMAR